MRKASIMARLEQRGPFLMLFALNQQLASLLAQAMAGAPLTPSDFAVYSALRLLEPTTPTELAATLGMRASTLSSVLAKMEQLAHLRRQPNPADGRSRLISLTTAGRTATEDCFPDFGRAIEAFRRRLSVDEQQALQYLEAVSRALHDAGAELSAGERKAGRPHPAGGG
jgi:DNA-binding MarR family transcriptional regulator